MTAALLIGMVAPALGAGFVAWFGELLDAVDDALAEALDEDLRIVLGAAW